METHVEKPATLNAPPMILQWGELLMVFLVPTLIIGLTGSWAGDNPFRSQGVVAGANVVMLLLIWVGLKIRRESWADFGLTFGMPTWLDTLKVIGWSLLVCLIASIAFIGSGFLPMGSSEMAATPDLSQYEFLRNNIGMLALSLGSVYIVSSFGEEVVYRAFLINRISQLGGGTKLAMIIAIVISSVVFGLAHYTWGPMGMIQTGFMGLAMAICYVILKKKLWALILAHAYMDTVLLLQMYLNG